MLPAQSQDSSLRKTIRRAVGIYEMCCGIGGVAAMVSLAVAFAPGLAAPVALFAALALAGFALATGSRAGLHLSVVAQLLQVVGWVLPASAWRFAGGPFLGAIPDARGATLYAGLEFTALTGLFRAGPATAAIYLNIVPLAVAILLLGVFRRRSSRPTASRVVA